MVPALAAGMRSGQTCASAPATTSTSRWLVSTLPPATARPAGGSSKLPSGITMDTARRHPSFSGSARPTHARNT